MNETPQEVAQKVVEAAEQETDPFMRSLLLATAAGYLADKAAHGD